MLEAPIPGDVEMREVAAALFGLVNVEAPSLFPDFALASLAEGTHVLKKSAIAP